MVTARSESTVHVVGAGIIGAALAFELQRQGKQVTLIDKAGVGCGASYGNMASIASTEFMPLSRPSVWKKIPGWLMAANGPVRIQPAHFPRLLPWFWRFVEAGRRSRVRELEDAGAALSRRIYDDLLPMLDAAGARDFLSSNGTMSIYTDEREFKADREHIDLMDRYQLPYEILTGEAIREREPAIGAAIKYALLLPDNRTIRDPFELVVCLARKFQSMGGTILQGNVVGFERLENRIARLMLDDGRSVSVEKIVLSAGVHTSRLARLIGEYLPLESERGYHTQLMSPGIDLGHALLWPSRAFMISPTAGGIRIGGTVEMASMEAPPDFRRARTLVSSARSILPGLQSQELKEWMGHRPALPDTIPVIGPSKKIENMLYATGHGHLGLTYSATTARLIADLLTETIPPLDMFPYRVDRF